MQKNFIRSPLSISDDHDFRLAVQNAPKVKALDGATMIYLQFVFPDDYSDPFWWPLRDTLAGYVP